MRLHFREYGQGTPLIILHGLFGSSDNWVTMSQKLSAHFHVFALDQRNHGQSPHSAAMNYDVMAADLSEFMQEHAIERALLLGHSMGGKTAMQFAMLHPEKVERLVVGDIAPRRYPPTHDLIFEALLGLDLTSFHERHEVDKALAANLPDLAVRRFLLKNLARDSKENFHWRFNLSALHQNYSSLNAAIESYRPFDKPVLFIRGGNSDYICEGDLPSIRHLFPRAEISEIPGAGHWVHAEAPEIFFRRVNEFFSQNILSLPA
jgi:esterase